MQVRLHIMTRYKLSKQIRQKVNCTDGGEGERGKVNHFYFFLSKHLMFIPEIFFAFCLTFLKIIKMVSAV